MKVILKGIVVVGGIALATALGSNVLATAASPTTTLTVQDAGSTTEGAAVDADGTMGDYKPAMDGTMTGPLMDAAPQDTTH
jgi:hypothetical protein